MIQDEILIEGGQRLEGEVLVSGSKNSALPILAATLLTKDECVIKNIPYLSDVETMMQILTCLGSKAERREDGSVVTKVLDETPIMAPYEFVRMMRASVCVLGPLLAKRKRAKVSMPGGCVIGLRPIDLHLKGMAALGASIEIEHGYVVADGSNLRGTEMFLGGSFGSTVLGTGNVMMAATLAQGTTVIENAACEPEVQDLANFLIAMGAKIDGVGTPRITIEGVRNLHGTTYSVIPDRIEAGTFMAAAAITSGDVTIKGIRIGHLMAVVDKLGEMGVKVKKLSTENGLDNVRVVGNKSCNSCDLTTMPYPGFPTDLQAQFAAILAIAQGISLVTEKIYPDRFMHIAELNRMGAKMRKEGPTVIIQGVDFLSGAPVMASDLRASAALVLAGLVARGETRIDRMYHLQRGYEKLEVKLQKLGAKIKMVEGKPGKSSMPE